MTSIDMIRASAQRIDGKIRRTPLLNAPLLDEIAGRRVFVKAECLQYTGSFKYRGATSAVTALSDAERAAGVLAFSSGNHAQGVALAAREAGISAVIVMPKDAPQLKIDNTRALGAEVVLYDRAGGESREEVSEAILKTRSLSLIKPFDDVQVIAGQGTTGLEIADQMKELNVSASEVLICCGGGGLTSGIALALEAEASGVTARPVEPEGFDDVTRSLKSGRREVNERLSGSLCDAIVTPSPGEITFPILHRFCGAGLVMSDEDCLRAMHLAWRHLKITLEPGGAISLAAALFHPEMRESREDIVVVVSGGNVDEATFQRALSLS